MDAALPKSLDFIGANKFEFAIRQAIILTGYCYVACKANTNW